MFTSLFVVNLSMQMKNLWPHRLCIWIPLDAMCDPVAQPSRPDRPTSEPEAEIDQTARCRAQSALYDRLTADKWFL